MSGVARQTARTAPSTQRYQHEDDDREQREGLGREHAKNRPQTRSDAPKHRHMKRPERTIGKTPPARLIARTSPSHPKNGRATMNEAITPIGRRSQNVPQQPGLPGDRGVLPGDQVEEGKIAGVARYTTGFDDVRGEDHRIDQVRLLPGGTREERDRPKRFQADLAPNSP